MAEKSTIQWTDNTVNFWRGCQKVSPGCKYCYMYRNQSYHGIDPKKITRSSDNTFFQALKWKEPKRVFTNSLSDFFLVEADEWRNDAWKVIESTPQHEWQILTKRPELVMDRLPKNWGEGWDQVILGVSVENQDYFYRAHELSLIPATRKFLSIEPLIGPINILTTIEGSRPIDSIDWVIIGGESGNDFGDYRYRKCEIEWIEKIIEDLKAEAPYVKIFVKQLGTYQAKQLKLKDRHAGEIDEWPTKLDHIKIREFADPILTSIS